MNDAIAVIMDRKPQTDQEQQRQTDYLAVLTIRELQPEATYAELGAQFKEKLTAQQYGALLRAALEYAAVVDV